MPRGVSLYDEARLQGRLWTPNAIRTQIFSRINSNNLSGLGAVTLKSDTTCLSIADSGPLGNGITAQNPTFCQNYGLNGWVTKDRNSLANVETGRGYTFSSPIPYTDAVGLSVFWLHQYQSDGSIINGGSDADIDVYFSGGKIVANRQAVINLVSAPNAFAAKTLYLARLDFKSNYSALSLGGITVSTNTTTTPNFATGGKYILNASGGQNGLVGPFAEMIFTSFVSPQVAANIEGEIAWRWGVPRVLDPTHRHRNRPPLIGD